MAGSAVHAATPASSALIKMLWPVWVAVRAVSVLHILIMITAEQFCHRLPGCLRVFLFQSSSRYGARNVPHP